MLHAGEKTNKKEKKNWDYMPMEYNYSFRASMNVIFPLIICEIVFMFSPILDYVAH